MSSPLVDRVSAIASAILIVGLAPGCTISHRGLPRLAPQDPSWGQTDSGGNVWGGDDVRVTAVRPAVRLEFPFGGRISNLQDAPVRVTFRPVGIDVPPGRAIGEKSSAGRSDYEPIESGETFVVAPHDPQRKPDPNDLVFGLHRTVGREGPAPFAPDDVVESHVTPSGILVTNYPGYARIGDEAHYEIVISGAHGDIVCPYDMQVVEGREIVDFPWWRWPIAIVLLPIEIPVWIFGWHH